LPRPACHALLEAVAQYRAVGQAGQHVLGGQLLEFTLVLLAYGVVARDQLQVRLAIAGERDRRDLDIDLGAVHPQPFHFHGRVRAHRGKSMGHALPDNGAILGRDELDGRAPDDLLAAVRAQQAQPGRIDKREH